MECIDQLFVFCFLNQHQPTSWYKLTKYSENSAGENLKRIGMKKIGYLLTDVLST